MRILDICHVYPPEHAPAGIQAAELAEDLARAGHDITVLTGWPNHPAGVLFAGWRARVRAASVTAAGFRVVRCLHSIHPRGRMAWRLWYYLTFAVSTFVNGLLCRRPDVVVCESTPVFGPPLALLLARLRRARFVYRIHDVHPEAAFHAGLLAAGPVYRLLRGLDTWVCRRATLVLTLTEGMRETLLGRGLPPERVVVARQWLDGTRVVPGNRDNPWRRAQGIPPGRFVILYAGTIGHVSGAQVVVEAARLLSDRADLLFLFVGDGPVRVSCERAARMHGLGNVRFLPFQPEECLSDVQATADVGVVTLLEGSGDTSIPSKVHGYTAAGRPVIASVRADSAIAEIVRDGDLGRVVAPGDAAALADAVVALAASPAEAARLGENARRFFERFFDRGPQTARVERILRVDVVGEEPVADVPRPADDPPVEIRAATRGDVEAISAVHEAAFPGFFMTLLGRAFLRAYYRGVLEFDAGELLVAEQDGRPVGFAAGFVDPDRFYRRMAARGWRFVPPLATGLARRPWLLGRVLRRGRSVGMRGRSRPSRPADVSGCELASLAVLPTARGRGIGRRLVAAFLEAARRRRADRVRLTTDARHNDAVNRFYLGSGFRLSARLQPDGTRPMNEYEYPLRAAG